MKTTLIRLATVLMPIIAMAFSLSRIWTDKVSLGG